MKKINKTLLLIILNLITIPPTVCMDEDIYNDSMSTYCQEDAPHIAKLIERLYISAQPEIQLIIPSQAPEPLVVFDDFAHEQGEEQSPEYIAWIRKEQKKKEYQERLWELQQEFERRSNLDFDSPELVLTEQKQPQAQATIIRTPQQHAPQTLNNHQERINRYNELIGSRPSRPRIKSTQEIKKRPWPSTALECQFVSAHINKNRKERIDTFRRDAQFWTQVIPSSKGMERMIDMRLRILRNMR